MTQTSVSQQLIGLAGRKGVGKDAVADLLAHYGYKKRALADPLKTICQDLFMLSQDQLWGTSKDVVDVRYNKTPRCLMQSFGTGFIRNTISDTFWVDRFRTWYKSQNDNIVVSDVRFLNEINLIHELGGQVILIKRPRLLCQDCHESELVEALEDHVDAVLLNDGTLQDLQKKVQQMSPSQEI